MKEILRDQDKMYALFEDQGHYLLSVMSGGVGMYEVKVQLDSDEVARYRQEGAEFITALAGYELRVG